MKLIITRHGETIENKKGILQGQIQGTLSKLGKEQAKKLANRLKKEKIDYIYSSDLARASDTAKEIVKFHPNTPIKFIKELRERNLGKYEGKKKSDFGLSQTDFLATALKSKTCESINKLYRRAKEFLDRTIRKHPKDTVLFVVHNGIDKAIICAILNKKAKDIELIENLDNTSLNIYEIDKKGNHKVRLFNCSKHLS